MDWRQTGDVGKVQLRQWHRALAAIAKVNSLQPIKEFTEQMAQLFNGALAAQIDDPFVLNIGMNERFGQDHLLHRSEEHTSELQSLMRISYAVFCLKKTILPPQKQSNNTN